MDLDVNRAERNRLRRLRIHPIRSRRRLPLQLHFAAAANSLLLDSGFQRGVARSRSRDRWLSISQAGVNASGYSLPAALERVAQAARPGETLPRAQGFDLAVRDAKTGFTFFNIEGHQYDYDANAQLLSIRGGRLLRLQRICRIPWAPGRSRRSGRPNLHRRGDADNRGRAVGERRTQIASHASSATRSRR